MIKNIALILLVASQLHAKKISVADATAFADAAKAVAAGDTLILQDGMWADARLKIHAEGTVEKPVTIKAQNWREIVQMARESGALNRQVLDTVEDALALLARVAGNPRTLDVPLEFAGGRVWLGPVPLGAAPVLRLR